MDRGRAAAGDAAQAQALVARGQASFTAGDLDAALARAREAIALHQANAAAWQLAAVVERRRGRLDEARSYFEAALEAAPSDAHILNSFANLLSDLGDLDAARRHYQQALAADAGHVEARVNLARALKRLGLRDEARRELETAVRAEPDNARAWHSLGLLLFEDADLQAAADALDRALVLQPSALAALKARAAVATELGEPAAHYLARARTLRPDDRALALAEAEAFQKAGDPDTATERLEAMVAHDPGHAAAHAASFEQALEKRPTEPELWWGYLGALMLARREHDVLARLAQARPVLGEICDRLEAVAASETGDLVRADSLFERLDVAADAGLRIAYLRHLLRAQRPQPAAALAERFAAAGDPAAWPYLATAWRLLEDPRWVWLEGHPTFVQAYDLPVSPAELSALGERLRALHRSRAAPIDQTLRGGTQTEGSLLSRREPEIAALRTLLSEAVEAYIARLPAPDPHHPLLAPARRGFRFAGSWSVRLTSSGFHVNHVHTTGWLSSAFYVSLPEEIGRTPGDERGWLTFGEPPAELGLGLRPFRTVEPKPGRLALFPSTLWHGTRPFDAGERLTVAFDITPLA